MFKWENGRQQSFQYQKMKIYSFKLFGRIGFDCYILRYDHLGYLPWHVDKVDGKHFRCNITLYGRSRFYIDKRTANIDQYDDSRWIPIDSNIVIFRADKYRHKLEVNSKTRKLSFGMAILNTK